jgi:flagellar biosynthetic protein FliR
VLSFSDTEVQLLFATYMWPFMRCLAMVQTAPVFSHRAIPQRVKLALAFMLAVIIGPAVGAQSVVDPFSGAGILMVVQQFVVGAAIGFGLRVVFAAFELAGDLIGLQMGLGFASFLDPARNAPSPVLATFLMLTATLVFMSIDGHLTLIVTLVESFTTIPVGPSPLAAIDWMRMAHLGTLVFSSGVQLALPVMGSVLMLNIALGFISRSAPQLSIFNIGFAITLMAGMLALWVTLGAMVGPISRITTMGVPYLR